MATEVHPMQAAVDLMLDLQEAKANILEQRSKNRDFLRLARDNGLIPRDMILVGKNGKGEYEPVMVLDPEGNETTITVSGFMDTIAYPPKDFSNRAPRNSKKSAE